MKVYCVVTAFANAITPIIVGALVLMKGKPNGLYRTYALACLAVFVWSFHYILWQFADTPMEAIYHCKWLMVGAIAITTFYTHHLLLLLEEKRPWLLAVNYFTGSVFVLVDLNTDFIVAGVRPVLAFDYWPIAGPLYLPFLLVFSGIITMKLWLVYKLMQKSQGTRRTQLVYVFWATIIAYAGGSSNYPLWFDVHLLPYGNPGASIYLMITSYAILKHRLMDISIIIRKTLIYAVVTMTLTGLYLGIITLFARLFEGFTGYQTVFSSAVAAGLITVCFQPLRKRVQGFVDGKFFRQYVDREEKLYELSREVITHTTPEAMGSALMHVINDSLHPKQGILYLRSPNGSGFSQVSVINTSSLPERLDEDNPLAIFFRDNPQPFLLDIKEQGRSYNTREKGGREDAA